LKLQTLTKEKGAGDEVRNREKALAGFRSKTYNTT